MTNCDALGDGDVERRRPRRPAPPAPPRQLLRPRAARPSGVRPRSSACSSVARRSGVVRGSAARHSSALLDDLSGRRSPSRARCPGRAAGSGPPRPGRPRPAACCPLRPRSRSIASADTVVSRSSHSRTGTGATRRGQPAGELADLDRRRPLAARERAGQPDDHLDRLLLGDQIARAGRRSPGRAARSRPGVARKPGRVAAGDADPGVAGVEPEPYAGRTGSAPAGRARRPRRATSASASSMREASVPPPWATSSLPPPLPPTSGADGADQRRWPDSRARAPRR